ncbi:hypothetical protein JRO89_XS01G0318900 [Xanthoceras sorbifolium]|uniref:Uncharacterized protein n=1 Tax=Xanthoceras sorbifolium TaxID=99658 RepID=A0ABQ8INH4_9ROSI|nr:hypothetical protein JRO89_XS01G0318900 [Xanthoceras sorbifolium]
MEVGEEDVRVRLRSTERDEIMNRKAPCFGVSELKSWSFWRAGIVEFVATFLYLYISLLTIMAVKKSTDYGDILCSPECLQAIAWASGGTIFALVYCFSAISGFHVAFWKLSGHGFNRFLVLVPNPLDLCAICGAAVVKAFNKTRYELLHGGANLANYESEFIGMFFEMFGTFVLLYAVFSATDAKRNAIDSLVPVLSPLPVGFAVFLVHMAATPLSQTGINPARSLATAIIYGKKEAWEDQWIYWIGPLIGTLFAALYYQIVLRPKPFKSRA